MEKNVPRYGEFLDRSHQFRWLCTNFPVVIHRMHRTSGTFLTSTPARILIRHDRPKAQSPMVLPSAEPARAYRPFTPPITFSPALIQTYYLCSQRPLLSTYTNGRSYFLGPVPFFNITYRKTCVRSTTWPKRPRFDHP